MVAIAEKAQVPLASLDQDFRLLPLVESALDLLAGEEGFSETDQRSGFSYLAPSILAALSLASFDGKIAYLETNYFGGTGGQGAGAFEAGKLVFGPKRSVFGPGGASSRSWDRPINQALRHLGVFVPKGKVDEFESVGLGRYRTTDDWLEFGTGADRETIKRLLGLDDEDF